MYIIYNFTAAIVVFMIHADLLPFATGACIRIMCVNVSECNVENENPKGYRNNVCIYILCTQVNELQTQNTYRIEFWPRPPKLASLINVKIFEKIFKSVFLFKRVETR